MSQVDNINEISRAFQTGYPNSDTLEMVYEAIRHNNMAVDEVLHIVESRDYPLFRLMICADLPKKSFELYRHFFVDDILQLFIESLEDSKSSYEKMCNNARQAKLKYGSHDACKVIMRELPYTKNDTSWYWDFLHSLQSITENIGLLRIVDKNFSKNYAMYQEGIKTQVSNDFRNNNQYIDEENEDDDDQEEIELFVCRSQKEFCKFGKNIERTTLSFEMRKYQEELAVAALQGKNTIICAPTGSGKTVVAVEIIRKHFHSASVLDPRRVVMLVPTVPLVDQQTIMFNRFLPNTLQVIGIAGGESIGFKAPLVLAAHVTVMTPQILINLLHSSQSADKLNFSDVTLLIFDECHHTYENHPYNVLMIDYHEYPSNNRPQIVGMTASLGVGSGRRIDTALEHMLLMAANLDCHTLSIIEHNVPDLEYYVPAPEDELIEVSRPNKNEDLFSVYINALMNHIESRIQHKLSALFSNNTKGIEKKDTEIPKDRESDQYQTWVSNLLRAKLPILQDGNLKRELTKFVRQLKIYYRALDLNAHLPTEHCFRYLVVRMSQLAESTTNDEELLMINEFNAIKQFLKKEAENPYEKEIVMKLRDKLMQQYSNKEDSRTIIFVRTREMALELNEHLNAHPILPDLKSGYLTSVVGNTFSSTLAIIFCPVFSGVNTSSANYGQASQMQVETLKDFASGTVKILVATSVAEEGLDIAKCNLIIKYNHVTNEVAMMQRRGRGRAEGSKSILIAQDGYIAEKELQNMQKEKLMTVCLKHLRSQGDRFFVTQISHKVMQLKEDRKMEKRQLEMKRREFGDKKYNLLCKSCNEFICRNESLRRLQKAHYVCCDPTIWKRAVVESMKNPRALGVTTMAGQLKCGKCRHEWGLVIKYGGVFLPGVKAGGFVVVAMETTNQMTFVIDTKAVSQWSKIERSYFIVEDITEKDKKKMLSALLRESSADKEMLENAAFAAEEKAAANDRKQCRIQGRNNN